MERYYEDPKTGWSLDWIVAMFVGFAGLLAVLILLWITGAF
jgi:hypothetical protein